MLYFPYVFLNICFTTDFLVTADVPYYQNPTPIDTLWTDRYKVEWWLHAVTILQIGVPALAAHAWLPIYPQESLLSKTRIPQPAIYILSKVVIIGILVIFVLEFILRIIQLVPGIMGCDDQMFCRNENPAKQSPNTANWLFIIHFIFLVVFIIIDGIYLAFIYIWADRAAFVYRTSWLAQTKVGQLFSRSLNRGPSVNESAAVVVTPPPPPSTLMNNINSQQQQPMYRPLQTTYNPPQQHQTTNNKKPSYLFRHNSDHTYTEIKMTNIGRPTYGKYIDPQLLPNNYVTRNNKKINTNTNNNNGRSTILSTWN